MSLILPSFYFVNQVNNFTGTPSLVLGTNFTAGANNTDGTAVTVLSALSFDVHYLIVGISNVITGASANADALLDVLIDPAGGTSWSSFIDDLMCGSTISPGFEYHFPIFIKSGTSIGVQARTAHTSDITLGRVQMCVFGNPSRPEKWWCGSKVETLGSTPASSKGTTVTPGSTGTYSSWTNIGSTTSARYGAIQFGLNGPSSASVARGYYWQIGYGSTQLPGSTTYYASSQTTTEAVARTCFSQLTWCDILSGTQMQARATSSGTAEDYTCALYGVY